MPQIKQTSDSLRAGILNRSDQDHPWKEFNQNLNSASFHLYGFLQLFLLQTSRLDFPSQRPSKASWGPRGIQRHSNTALTLPRGPVPVGYPFVYAKRWQLYSEFADISAASPDDPWRGTCFSLLFFFKQTFHPNWWRWFQKRKRKKPPKCHHFL